MCGRARLSSDVSEIKIPFGLPPERPTPNIATELELGADRSGAVVYYDAKDGGRRLEVMRWGLIPYGRRTSKSASRPSTPGPRRSTPSRRSVRRLLIHGLVKGPLIFSLEALARYPMETRVAFIECGGNTGDPKASAWSSYLSCAKPKYARAPATGTVSQLAKNGMLSRRPPPAIQR